MKFKPYVLVLAVMVGMGVIGSAVRATASPAMGAAGEDHDYSKNKRYQQGQREGRDDRGHHRDHFRKRHFAHDEDNRAYEAGYQQGHGVDVHIDVK